jgi:DNA-directed RNA polymerase specialized sigma subunit
VTALYKETLSRSGFRFIEKILYEYKTYNTAIAELEAEINKILDIALDIDYPLKASDPSSIPSQGTGSPTEHIAIKRAENIHVKYLRNKVEEMQRHKKAIDEAMIYLTDTEKQLIKLFYTLEKPARECWKQMHIEKSRWYELRKEIVEKIARHLAVY